MQTAQQQTVLPMKSQLEKQQESVCKNHTDRKSGYFSVEHPWLKYCETCALNMALCGKKIEKQLNSKQFSNKLILSSLIIDLSTTVSEADKASKNYLQIVGLVQKNNNPFRQKLVQLDELIQNLIQKRQDLCKVYQSAITNKVSQCYQKQNKMILAQIQLKKSIQNIECNYTSLLNEEANRIQEQVKHYQTKIQNCKQFFPTLTYHEDTLKNIHETAYKFKVQFENLSNYKVDMGWLKEYGAEKTSRKSSRQNTSRSNRMAIQNKQNFDNQMFECLESKLLCSTNQSGRTSSFVSGLQSIADMEPILQQIDSKRQNRAHLQLRSSKLKEKRQKSMINIDVKQQRKSSSSRVKTNF